MACSRDLWGRAAAAAALAATAALAAAALGLDDLALDTPAFGSGLAARPPTLAAGAAPR